MKDLWLSDEIEDYVFYTITNKAHERFGTGDGDLAQGLIGFVYSFNK